jgi:hypothetical protein
MHASPSRIPHGLDDAEPILHGVVGAEEVSRSYSMISGIDYLGDAPAEPGETARLPTDSPELPLGFVTKPTILYSKM